MVQNKKHHSLRKEKVVWLSEDQKIKFNSGLVRPESKKISLAKTCSLRNCKFLCNRRWLWRPVSVVFWEQRSPVRTPISGGLHISIPQRVKFSFCSQLLHFKVLVKKLSAKNKCRIGITKEHIYFYLLYRSGLRIKNYIIGFYV